MCVDMYTYIQYIPAGHHGFLEDIGVKIIDRLYGKDMIRVIFWQHQLETFMT